MRFSRCWASSVTSPPTRHPHFVPKTFSFVHATFLSVNPTFSPAPSDFSRSPCRLPEAGACTAVLCSTTTTGSSTTRRPGARRGGEGSFRLSAAGRLGCHQRPVVGTTTTPPPFIGGGWVLVVVGLRGPRCSPCSSPLYRRNVRACPSACPGPLGRHFGQARTRRRAGPNASSGKPEHACRAGPKVLSGGPRSGTRLPRLLKKRREFFLLSKSRSCIPLTPVDQWTSLLRACAQGAIWCTIPANGIKEGGYEGHSSERVSA